MLICDWVILLKLRFWIKFSGFKEMWNWFWRIGIECKVWFGILQDHHKFQQRYYEFLDYFRMPDGPIFLKICGESSCDGIANDYIGVSYGSFWVVLSVFWLLVLESIFNKVHCLLNGEQITVFVDVLSL